MSDVIANATAQLGDPARMAENFSIAGLLNLVIGGWRLILLGVLTGTVVAAIGLRWWPGEYTATMVVGPTARSGLAAMGPRFPAPPGRVATSATEYGSGDESLSDFARFLQLLTSVPVATSLTDPADPLRPMVQLFPNRWNSAEGRWQPPAGITGNLRAGALALADRSDWIVPGAEAIAGVLRRRLVIQPIGTSPMRRLSFRHPDRSFALALLARIAGAADRHLKVEAARRDAAQIAHVRSRLAANPVAEHRQALADLLAGLEQVAMMIEVDLPFAADPIEPPSAPPVPDWPDPLSVLPLSATAGAVLGLVLVFASGHRQGGERRRRAFQKTEVAAE